MKIWQIVMVVVGLGAVLFGIIWLLKPDDTTDISSPTNQNNNDNKPIPKSNTFAEKGLRGQNVKDVQIFINSLGFNPQLKPDSVFGAKTENAVQSVFGKSFVTNQDWSNRHYIGAQWKKVGTSVLVPIKTGGILDYVTF